MRKLLLLVLMFSTPAAMGFINIESVRMGAKDDFVGKSQLLLSGNGGNTNKSTSAFSSVNIRRWYNSEALALIDYTYETTNDVRNVNNGRMHFRYTTQTREPIAYEFYMQGELDEFQNLNSRRLVGTNARFELHQTDTSALLLGLGGFYETEDYSQAEDRQGVRGNIYLSYTEKINELLQGSAVIYYQPSLARGNDARVRLQTGLNFQVTERFAINMDFELRHESNLPDPRLRRTDIRYLAGFSVNY